MTDTEKRYAQIEKEPLAVTWSCEKFSCYILGRHFDIETNLHEFSVYDCDSSGMTIASSMYLESFCTLQKPYQELP